MYLKTFGGASLRGSSLARPKPLLLLSYLAVEGARSRQHLRELFWPGASDPAASLRVALKQIREAAPGALREEQDILHLTVNSDVHDLVTAFREKPELILSLYQGEFLSGLTLEDTGDEESELSEWVLSTREHLARQVRSRLLRVAETRMQGGDHGEAAELVRRIYHLPGGVPMDSVELQRLYTLAVQCDSELNESLRQEARELDLSLVEPLPLSPSEVKTASLPVYATSFIGRETELRELAALLNDPAVRLLTILGVGGIGKTRLAGELAQRRDQTRITYVPLATVSNPELLPYAIAQALQINMPSGAPPLPLVVSAIGDQPLTLILDNYEPLLPSTEVVTELLGACPNLHVLITSRERLGVAPETVYPLTGLDMSDGEFSDAARLFISRARQANARLRTTPENWETVLEICQRLDASPLGIELAAAWVRSMPLSQIAQELAQGLELLETAGEELGKRRSLRGIFEQAWAKLPSGEQTVLKALSVFRGGFTRVAATTVTGTTLRPLLGLLDAAFLNLAEDGRYSQHPLLSHYVQMKAAEAPETLQQTRRDFVTYYSREAWQAWQDYGSRHQLRSAQWGYAEYDNLQAAIEYATAEQQLTEALYLCVNQSLEWVNRGLLRQGAEQLNSLLVDAEAAGLSAEESYRWGLVAFCYLSLYSGGWSDGAAQRLEQVIALAQTHGDIPCLVQAMHVQGVFYAVTGQLLEAKKVFLEALSIAQQGQAHYEEARSLSNLLSVSLNLGHDDAPDFLERGLDLAVKHQLGFVEGAFLLLKSEGMIAKGLFADIPPSLDRAEEIFIGLRRWKDLAFVYKLRGLTAFLRYPPSEGRLNNTFDFAAAALAESDRLMAGNAVNRTMDLLIPQLGDMFLAKGDLAAAQQFFEDKLHDAEGQKITPLVMNCHYGLGRIAHERGDYQTALTHFQSMLRLTSNIPARGLGIEAAAATISRLGDTETALKLWGAAQQEREDICSRRYPVYAESYEKEVARVQNAIGADAFNKGMVEGRQANIADAVASALHYQPSRMGLPSHQAPKKG